MNTAITGMPGPTRLADGIAAYLHHKLSGAQDVRIEQLVRIPGGASRETWSFDGSWRDGDGEQRRGFILRRDPDASLLETPRDVEYTVYRAFAQSLVPVPRVYWLELDPEPLDRPFFIMERIDGCATDPQALAARPDDADRRRIAQRKFEILGAIHAADPATLGLLDLHPAGPPAPAECAARELHHWQQIIDTQQQEALPIIRLAIAWLRHHPPPPAQRIVVCHGDYRSGNFLYARDDVRGILDWEMVHLGDPLEDLAWTCLLNWRYGARPGERSALIGGIAPRENAFATYSAAAGVTVDANALHWWAIFSHVKAVGIWVTGGRSFSEGRTQNPMMALIPRLLNATQYAAILDLLGW